MGNIERFGVPMKLRLELSAVVCLEHVNSKWEPLSDIIEELDRCLLIASVVDFKDSNTRAVVYCRELVEALPRAWYALQELHIQLYTVTGLSFLVALPALLMRLVVLVSGEAPHTVSFKQAMNRRYSYGYLVITL